MFLINTIIDYILSICSCLKKVIKKIKNFKFDIISHQERLFLIKLYVIHP